MRCAAGALCKAVGIPIPTALNNINKPQHECAICKKGMHGMGHGCGLEAGAVKCQLADDVVNRMDTSKHLVCWLCFESNKKDGASDIVIDTPPTNQNESRGDNNDMEVEVIAIKPSGTTKNNNKRKKQHQPTIFGVPPPPQNKGNTTGNRGKGGVNEDTVQRTNEEKLAIMIEIDRKLPGITQKAILDGHKVPKSTFDGWRKNRKEIERSVAENKGKKKKVVKKDGLKRGE